MDVPATVAGRVVEVLVSRGSKVSQGVVLARVEATGGAAATATKSTATAVVAPVSSPATKVIESAIGAAPEPDADRASGAVWCSVRGLAVIRPPFAPPISGYR